MELGFLFRWGLLAIVGCFAPLAHAITVSGRITEADGVGVGGVRITVEQVGGELPLFTTTTAPDGTFVVSDPLLFGNLRITPGSSDFTFAPAQREVFTDTSVNGQNFSASASRGGDITVLGSTGQKWATPASAELPLTFLNGLSTLALTLRNDGASALTNLHATFSGEHASEFIVAGDLPSTLAPGGLASITVQAIPAGAGQRTAALTIASSDPNEGEFVINLSVTALSLTVTNTLDAGPGSLRQAFANAALLPGPNTILLSPNLGGNSITLFSPIVANDAEGVTLDATAQPFGFNLRANNTNRIFHLQGGPFHLIGLGLQGGRATTSLLGAFHGGAILSQGTLRLERCALSGNEALQNGAKGGAIYHEGTLVLDHTTFLNNRAQTGGAVYTEGPAEITGCSFGQNTAITEGGALAGQASCKECVFYSNTAANGGAVAGQFDLNFSSLFDNSAQNQGGALRGQGTLFYSTLARNQADLGGAIFSTGPLALAHCTLSLDSARTAGGALFVTNTLRLANSIVAQNLGPDPDLHWAGTTLVMDGINVLGDTHGSGLPMSAELRTGDARLAPLADYGGPTPTMALRSGSPALNAAEADLSLTRDQRGLPMVGTPDLGAYEAGTRQIFFSAYIWESLPSAIPADHEPSVDFDGDGVSNLAEWQAFTNPADPGDFFRLQVENDGHNIVVSFPTQVGCLYTLWQTEGMPAVWTHAGLPDLAGNGAALSFVRAVESGAQKYWRVQVRH